MMARPEWLGETDWMGEPQVGQKRRERGVPLEDVLSWTAEG